MKVNIKRLAVIVVITVMATFMMTAVASAGSLKTQGQYVSTGGGTCLLAFFGFNPDPLKQGVPNLYPATGLGWSIQTFTSEGVWAFERDGTGSFTGQNRSVTLPFSMPISQTPVVPSAGVQEVSFAFHYTVADGTISITADDGTYVIQWIYGPSPLKTYHLDGFSRTGYITPDGKTIILNGGAPDFMQFKPPLEGLSSSAQNICNGSYVLIWQNDVNP